MGGAQDPSWDARVAQIPAGGATFEHYLECLATLRQLAQATLDQLPAEPAPEVAQRVVTNFLGGFVLPEAKERLRVVFTVWPDLFLHAVSMLPCEGASLEVDRVRDVLVYLANVGPGSEESGA